MKYSLCTNEILLDIFGDRLLKFRVIDDEYIVKISRGIVFDI